MKTSRAKHKQPTMYDVAKLAGVSQPTVSRVLNRNDTTVQISDETRERVLDAIKKLGYRPNVIARSLRTQRTQMIALLIADISNSYYHPIARAIQEVARQHDYEVLISNSDHLYANERHFCDVVSRRAIDGMILVPIHLTTAELDDLMRDTNAPIVVLGQHVNHPNIDVVYLDDVKAMYDATTWLIRDRGYTNLGIVGVGENYHFGPRRFEGFKSALHDAGLALDPRFVLEGDYTLDSGMEAARRLIALGDMPRAVFALNDLMGIGLILGFQEAGFRVPEDVAVIGFDNIPEACIVRPTLTTVLHDSWDIGCKLAQALFERIEDPTIIGQRRFETTYEIIPRQST